MSIDNFTEGKIEVFPVPASEAVQISYSIEANLTYELYNTAGVLVQKGEVNAENKSIQVDLLSRGIYFLKLKNENGSSRAFKVVKD